MKQASLLRYLFTSISLQRPRFARPVIAWIAPGVAERLAQHRGHEGLTPEEIRTYPVHALARGMGGRLWRLTQRRFARAAGLRGVEEGCGVLAFNTAALETFGILTRNRLPCILDQASPTSRWSVAKLRPEYEMHGDWGVEPEPAPEDQEREQEEARLAHLVVCGSEFCARSLQESGVDPSKVVVVPYGADVEKFTPRASPPAGNRGARLLFVGRLSIAKGVHYLLEAVRRLKALDVTVTTVGAARVRESMLARYSTLVRRHPYVLHGDMPRIYGNHDIYVFPSLLEGSSLSIYEALACGLPTITTPNAGSIVRDGIEGLIVPPGNIDALVAAIERLVRNREERCEMARAARLRAEHYGSWTAYGSRLADAVTRVAGASKP